MFQYLPLSAAQEVHDSSIGKTPCIVVKNDGGSVPSSASRISLKIFLCTTTSCQFNFDPERCYSFVNIVLGRSQYPYESQCSTYCSRLMEYCRRWLHQLILTVLVHVHKAGSSRIHHYHVTAVLPVLFIKPL